MKRRCARPAQQLGAAVGVDVNLKGCAEACEAGGVAGVDKLKVTAVIKQL